MPPLALHTAIAKEIADRLGHRTIDADLGSFYLGSTAPDIRVLLRCQREKTHFFDLHRFDQQNSVRGLFQAYPDLAQPDGLGPSTVAFLAGYISHLVMDETWIQDIYRPHFGTGSPLRGDIKANILDRVLQYELDRRQRSDSEKIARITREVAASALAVDVGFLDIESIHRWRQIATEVVNYSPDWERFRYIASRHLRAAGVDTPEAFAEFLKGLPDMLAEAMKYLGPQRLQAFLDRSLERGLEAIREYLQCE
ncbi:MAG: zinc dependent phospholipase C family protein [Dehalococcoidia bacterium]